ncbi:hypothetical protein [Streptomyces sp. NBC_01314]|uniref:hypothetical protein n=1 Tax=Streptomyces sp. NBC_01314 TaxID=2903821 RepID=UPI0030903A92|nr:hypothetical protein OG622_19255 [Streptomyces sp. NBC_01314]
MRNRSSRLRRIAAVGAVLAVALGTGWSGAASAGAAEDEAVVSCLHGYVCLQPLFGAQPVLVKEGDRATYSPALRVSAVVNATNTAYCIGGSLSYPLGPGQTQTWDHGVNYVSPATGGFCPL